VPASARLVAVVAVLAAPPVFAQEAPKAAPSETPPSDTSPPSEAPPPVEPSPVEPSPPASDAAPAPTPVPNEPQPALAPLPAEPPSAPPPAPTPPPTATFAPAPTVAPEPAAPARAQARPAPPSAPSPETPALTEPAAPSSSNERDGLFGPFRIGPLFGVGLPSLLSFGGEIKLTRYLGAGVNVGVIPAVRLPYYGEATVSYQDYGAFAHVHPLGGGFLLGAQLGYALVKGTYDDEVDTSRYAALGAPSSLDVHAEGSVETLVLTPVIGYVYTWQAGFTFGVDAGAQIPVASSRVRIEDDAGGGSLPTEIVESYLLPNRKKVRETLEKVGQTVLPACHLRIGWLL
jgi:hypothetical protein